MRTITLWFLIILQCKCTKTHHPTLADRRFSSAPWWRQQSVKILIAANIFLTLYLFLVFLFYTWNFCLLVEGILFKVQYPEVEDIKINRPAGKINLLSGSFSISHITSVQMWTLEFRMCKWVSDRLICVLEDLETLSCFASPLKDLHKPMETETAAFSSSSARQEWVTQVLVWFSLSLLRPQHNSFPLIWNARD